MTITKRIKTVFIMIISLLIAIYSSISVYAIGFDFDQVSKSVFIIVSKKLNNGAIGTGFAVDNSHIITNAHVIINKDNTLIGNYSEDADNNIGDTYKVDVVSIDEKKDIAILKVEGIELTPLKMADSDTVKVGDSVYAIGTPEGLPYTLTSGTVSSKKRVINDISYVQTDAAINQGNSGGPLLNEFGYVIGMNTLKLTQGENIGFAISSNVLKKYISDLNTSGKDEENSSSYNSSIYEDEENSQDEHDNNHSILYIFYSVLSLISIIAGIIVLCLRIKARREIYDFQLNTNNNINNQPVNSAVATPQKATIDLIGVYILSGNMAGKQIEFESEKTVGIGKDSDFSFVRLDDSYNMVSRMHCTVMFSEKFNKYFVTDCSSNGTYFENGTRLQKNIRTPIERGTVLKLANDSCEVKLL